MTSPGIHINRPSARTTAAGIFFFCGIFYFFFTYTFNNRLEVNIENKMEVTTQHKVDFFTIAPKRVVANKLKEVPLMICVLSDPKNTERRHMIRRTWALSKPNNTMTFFIIATKHLHYGIRMKIKDEQKLHSDLILLQNLEDSYDKLTDKVLGCLEWVYRNTVFDYVLKVDDDTFVWLDEFIKRLNTKPTELLYWGFFNNRSPIVTEGKWAEHKHYICDTYVSYALGGGYVLSRDVVKYIVENSSKFKKFSNEDVSIGTWLAPLEVNVIHDESFRMSGDCKEHHIVLHYASTSDMKKFNQSLLVNGTLCGTKEETKPNTNSNSLKQQLLKNLTGYKILMDQANITL